MASPAGNSGDARAWAVATARHAAEYHCEDLVVLDLRGVSPMTEYFVIATGTSDRQMRALADELARRGKAAGHPAWHVEGRDSATWIVLDFVDVVVHLFDQARRSYYDLELIWGAAPRVDWRAEAGGPDAERSESNGH